MGEETSELRAKKEYESLSITAVNVDSCFPPPSLAHPSATYMEEIRGRLDKRKRQGNHFGGEAYAKGRNLSWLNGELSLRV